MWCCEVWCAHGVVWCGVHMVWCGEVWCGVVRCGVHMVWCALGMCNEVLLRVLWKCLTAGNRVHCSPSSGSGRYRGDETEVTLNLLLAHTDR